ncbi:hypothetical protein Pla110_29800 [Polystyrenella longa]|uniref:Uncharacterized protein n=1 Tax=Polystyrenella longa TaxID=2528007 RepID=A0A518CPT9_9PLAN|nr:hypothetical protein [Polystyrenella longa]QDU81241.1 hypothetical protein Pla110_29800 [Polystyrenella longa]
MKKILSLLMVLPLVWTLTGCCCLGGGSSGCNSCGTSSYYGPTSYSGGGCSTGNCGVTQTYPSGAMSYPQGAMMAPMGAPATAAYPTQTYATASAPLESLPTY